MCGRTRAASHSFCRALSRGIFPRLRFLRIDINLLFCFTNIFPLRFDHVDYRSRGIGPLHATAMSLPSLELPLSSFNEHEARSRSVSPKAHYSPPWANTSIIGIAGSSGSGKTSLSMAIIKELSLPWVVILSMDSFYKVLTPEQSQKAFRNEYDFDAPEAIDFDVLVEKLRDIKMGYAFRRWCTAVIAQLTPCQKKGRYPSVFL